MLLRESILLLSKFVKLCPKITILYVVSHLAIFFVRLVLYRWLFSSLSDISPNTFIDDYQNQLIKFCGSIIIASIIYNYTDTKIRYIYNEIIVNIYKKIKEKILSTSTYDLTNVDKKNLITIVDDFYIFEMIYETILISLPKTILYLMYYFYNLYSFNFKTLLTIIIINYFTVKLSKLFYIPKQKCGHQLYDTTSNIKNNHIEIIKNIKHIKMSQAEIYENSLQDKLYNNRLNYRNNEYKYGMYYSVYTENITDVIETVMFYTLASLVVEQKLKSIELIYLGSNSSNMINYSIGLNDCINVLNKYIPQIKTVEKILNLENEEKSIIGNETLDLSNKNNIIVELIDKNNKNAKINFYKNKINFIFGKNGSGKTSLVETLFKLNKFDGEININSKSLSEINLRDISAYIYQEPLLFDNRSVEDNILYGIKLYNSDLKILSTEQNKILDKYELYEWFYKFTHRTHTNKLSGGEKKKLQIVNALLKFDDVQIFVFDEPTNNLDVKIVEWYKFVINKLVEDNKYVIVISHDERLTSSTTEEKKNIILMHELSNSIKLNFIY